MLNKEKKTGEAGDKGLSFEQKSAKLDELANELGLNIIYSAVDIESAEAAVVVRVLHEIKGGSRGKTVAALLCATVAELTRMYPQLVSPLMLVLEDNIRREIRKKRPDDE